MSTINPEYCSRPQLDFYEFLIQYVERFPIYVIDKDDPKEVAARNAIIVHVDTQPDLRAQLADATTDAERNQLQQRIEEVDAEIDRRVYELYGLEAEEIGIVEGAI